jgi:hypothetical protein
MATAAPKPTQHRRLVCTATTSQTLQLPAPARHQPGCAQPRPPRRPSCPHPAPPTRVCTATTSCTGPAAHTPAKPDSPMARVDSRLAEPAEQLHILDSGDADPGAAGRPPSPRSPARAAIGATPRWVAGRDGGAQTEERGHTTSISSVGALPRDRADCPDGTDLLKAWHRIAPSRVVRER